MPEFKIKYRDCIPASSPGSDFIFGEVIKYATVQAASSGAAHEKFKGSNPETWTYEVKEVPVIAEEYPFYTGKLEIGDRFKLTGSKTWFEVKGKPGDYEDFTTRVKDIDTGCIHGLYLGDGDVTSGYTVGDTFSITVVKNGPKYIGGSAYRLVNSTNFYLRNNILGGWTLPNGDLLSDEEAASFNYEFEGPLS